MDDVGAEIRGVDKSARTRAASWMREHYHLQLAISVTVKNAPPSRAVFNAADGSTPASQARVHIRWQY